MKNSHLKGIGVISIAEGKRLGTVDRAYFDAERRMVVGFVVHEGGGLLSSEPDRNRVVDTSEVHSLGPDAMMVADETVMLGEETTARYADLVDIDDLLTRKAVTEGGTQIGDVAAVDFDEQSFALRSVEVSQGFFQSNREIPADQIVSIGLDVLVMNDEVCAPEPTSDVDSSAAGGGRHFVVEDRRTEA